MSDEVKVRRALVSVSDKSGLVELAHALTRHGVEVVSTGGTASEMRGHGAVVRDVSEVTGFPEMMDGRVKTLHPGIHGGILALRERESHAAALKEHGIEPIDLVIVDLYPFESTVASGADFATCVENIDIGGPAMIRSAAKNHGHVAVIVDVEDYSALIGELDSNGGATTAAFRMRLAGRAFERTAAYDAAVSEWMASAEAGAGGAAPTGSEDGPRRRVVLAGKLALPLRYGENPHQSAAFYATGSSRPCVATATRHQGKELSYNNVNDADAAFELACEFAPEEGPACVIVKHANPCGVARAGSAAQAYTRAFDCDRVSAFGGIVAFNVPIDAEAARAVAEVFSEVVIAPAVDDGAREIFADRKNLRLLTTGGLADPRAPRQAIRQVSGGFLLQDADVGHVGPEELKTVTKRAPDDRELADLRLAWIVAKHVKSNAIVYARDGATVGIGAGQMSRVDSARIAGRKAADMAEALGLGESPAKGSAAASDAFFPFADGLESVAESGATALIQPGGAMRDEEVIAAADRLGLAMVFTGIRHFRH